MRLYPHSFIFLVVIIFEALTPSYAQELHTPAQIIQIMSESDLKYIIGDLDITTFNNSAENLPIIDHGLYIEPDQAGILQLKNYNRLYDKHSSMREILNQAEKSYLNGKMSKARKAYLKFLSAEPKNSQLMTYIGQTYGMEQEYDKAKQWYIKAIKTNFIDYLAHWLLADIYVVKGNKLDAVKEITVAHVLNRNNPRLFDKLEEIYAFAGFKYQEWKFKPIYSISKQNDSTIVLKHDAQRPEWMIYMLCKAMWTFEPGYKEKMLNTTTEIPRIVEEKECLLNLVTAYKTQHGEKKSEIEAINKILEAMEKKQLNEFILYEILLKENPLVVYSGGKKAIQEIVKYVLAFRTTKI